MIYTCSSNFMPALKYGQFYQFLRGQILDVDEFLQ